MTILNSRLSSSLSLTLSLSFNLTTTLLFTNVADAAASIAEVTGQTYYLHLEGNATGALPETVTNKLNTVFIKPLNDSGSFSIHSYILLVQGPLNHFTLNLVLEPKAEGNQQALLNYIKTLEAKTFLDQPIQFKKVSRISEIALLQIGYYDGNQQEDAFVKKFEVGRDFTFSNLSQWSDFSNEYGFALLSKNHEKFESYILRFAAETNQLNKVKTSLTENNMVAIESIISIKLEDGTLIEPNWIDTPFLPFRFFRNCFEAQFENGTCFKNVLL